MAKSSQSERDEDQLFEAFATSRGSKEARAFLADIATPREIAALAERWRIAGMLDAGTLTYREIAGLTGASTATIVRVAKFLRDEPHQGYRVVLDRLAKSGLRDEQ